MDLSFPFLGEKSSNRASEFEEYFDNPEHGGGSQLYLRFLANCLQVTFPFRLPRPLVVMLPAATLTPPATPASSGGMRNSGSPAP